MSKDVLREEEWICFGEGDIEKFRGGGIKMLWKENVVFTGM